MMDPNTEVACVKHILVVDDIIDNSFLLKVMLEEEGYSVDVADSGYAALRKLEDKRPDLILLDVMMPGMSGYDVTRYIRQNDQSKDIPILLVTGYDGPTAGEAFDSGANGLIHKPIDFCKLLDQVRSLLDSTQPPNPSSTFSNPYQASLVAERVVVQSARLS